MSASLTRKERQARTRSGLLRAAACVFARRGIHHGSIDEVAQEAGFTKGAVYANFASKQELFLAMLDERFTERREQIVALRRAPGKIEAQAREAVDELGHSLVGDSEWQRLFFEFAAHASRDEAFHAEFLARHRALRAELAMLFQERSDDLGIALRLPPETLAMLTFAMAHGVAMEALLDPQALPEGALGELLATFFAGLRVMDTRPDEHLQ
jgi:AcrR family transcriptional regulator